MYTHHEMAVNQPLLTLPLPSSDSFVNQVQSLAMPQILAIAAACLSAIVAMLLIRALRNA